MSDFNPDKLRPVNSFARWLPATGVLAAVALSLTGLISPPPPVAGAPAAEIAAYYARHHTGLEIESVADGLGVMLLVIFAATFHARLRTVPSLTAFGASAILAACTLVQVAVFHALAFRISPDPTRAVVLNDLQTFAFQVTTFPTLLFLGAAGTAILHSGALPRRLAAVAFAAGALQAVAWVSFFAPYGILAAGALPDIAAFTALLAWLVACSVVMLVRAGPNSL
jgi:hypothetical protein